MVRIFTYIYHQKSPKNVGKHTSPMDPMGNFQHKLILGELVRLVEPIHPPTGQAATNTIIGPRCGILQGPIQTVGPLTQRGIQPVSTFGDLYIHMNVHIGKLQFNTTISWSFGWVSSRIEKNWKESVWLIQGLFDLYFGWNSTLQKWSMKDHEMQKNLPRNPEHNNNKPRVLNPIGSMGLVYLPTWMVDFYGFHVGKYTIVPWILWEGDFFIHLGMSIINLPYWSTPMFGNIHFLPCAEEIHRSSDITNVAWTKCYNMLTLRPLDPNGPRLVFFLGGEKHLIKATYKWEPLQMGVEPKIGVKPPQNGWWK